MVSPDLAPFSKGDRVIVSRFVGPKRVYRLISFSGGTFLRGVQGNPNYFPILVQGDAVHGISSN